MSKIKVWVDAGHGNNGDPGAVGIGGRKEADDNLKMANAIYDCLIAKGFSANRTRTANVTGINRTSMANNWGADVFLCVHRNAFRNASANGFETFTFSTFSKKEDELANAIQRRCVAVGIQSNRGVKRSGAFTLLQGVKADAVLIEYNFVTNAKDNELFDKNLKAYAEATVQAVIDVYGEQKGNVSETDKNKQSETASSAGKTAITEKSVATAAQMKAYIQRLNPGLTNDYVNQITALYISEGEIEGIRGDIAFAQSCIETGNFKFVGGTAVTIDQNNFCGMGVVQLGVKGNSYKTPQDGIRAQIQHLKAYANEMPLVNPIVTPTVGAARFRFVQRGVSPYVEWLGQQENPQGKGWAVGAGYGSKILSIFRNIIGASAESPAVNPLPFMPNLIFKEGDIVQFTGGGVYVSSSSDIPTHSRGKSQCRVTKTANARNPYHLVSMDDSKVHGWVVAAYVQAIGSDTSKSPALKPIDDIAREVIRGSWGNGQDRINRLNAAGYDAKAVQSRVNQLMR